MSSDESLTVIDRRSLVNYISCTASNNGSQLRRTLELPAESTRFIDWLDELSCRVEQGMSRRLLRVDPVLAMRVKRWVDVVVADGVHERADAAECSRADPVGPLSRG